MNRPTAAQQSWAKADTYARIQLDTQSLRREHAANRAEPVKHLRVVPDAELMLPATLMDNLIFWACSLAGLGIWAAAGYAAWWAAGVYVALQGVTK